MTKCFWLVFLVGLSMTHILSQHCDSLNFHLHEITLQSLIHLTEMRPRIPIVCFTEIRAFEFPKEILLDTQLVERDIQAIFYQISLQIINVFDQDTFHFTWDKELLSQFQMDLYEEAEHLQECWQEKNKDREDRRETREGDVHSLQLRNLELRRYFNRILQFLKDKKYSRCAWDIVLAEVIRCFLCLEQFHRLYYKLNKNRPTSRKN